jgi:hypothetical protein
LITHLQQQQHSNKQHNFIDIFLNVSFLFNRRPTLDRISSLHIGNAAFTKNTTNGVKHFILFLLVNFGFHLICIFLIVQKNTIFLLHLPRELAKKLFLFWALFFHCWQISHQLASVDFNFINSFVVYLQQQQLGMKLTV